MTSRVDSAGTWSWTYDGESSRALSEALRSPTGEAWVVSYAYVSNTFDLASVACGSHTTAYSWAAGRLTNVSWSVAAAVSAASYSYLPDSDLLSEISNPAFEIRREYDAAARLTRIYATNSAGLINSFSYTLDSLGRRIRRDDVVPSAGGVGGGSISYSYDPYDQLISATRTNGPNGAFDAAYNFGYQYDLVGNRLHEDRGQLDLDGTFNTLNQLTHLGWGGKLDVPGSVGSAGVTVKVDGVTAAMFNTTNYLGGGRVRAGSNTISIVAYDAASKRTESLRRVFFPPTNPQQFRWDKNGNLTNDLQRAYTWDEENRLAAIESVAPLYERKRSEYLYDAQSRRIQKTDLSGWNGSAYATTNTTRFVWDGWLLFSEISNNGSQITTNQYVWGTDLSGTLQGAGGIGGLLGMVRGPPTNVYFFTFDGNGNAANVLDASGSEVASYPFDPFGRLISSSGSFANSNPWLFSTKYFEPAWGLYYYGYRWYSPNLHIWPSRDPIGERGYRVLSKQRSNRPAGNPYVFVLNNPLRLIDPRGLEAADPCAEAYKKLSKKYVGEAGALVCHNGKLLGCVWNKDDEVYKKYPGLLKCYQEHEDLHAKQHPDLKCEACKTYRPTFDPKETKENECEAYKATVDCLIAEHKKACGTEYDPTTPTSDKEGCEFAFSWKIDSAKDGQAKNCETIK